MAGGVEAFLAQGGGVAVALGVGECGVEPVVAYGDGGGHFSGVEEVFGVPVFECGGGVELFDCAVEVFFFTCQPPCHGGVEDDAECVSALGEEAFAVGEVVAAGGELDGEVGAPEEFVVDVSREGVCLDTGFDGGLA